MKGDNSRALLDVMQLSVAAEFSMQAVVRAQPPQIGQLQIFQQPKLWSLHSSPRRSITAGNADTTAPLSAGSWWNVPAGINVFFTWHYRR